MERPIFFVLGPRRSGTNFFEQTLLSNIDCNLANLNAAQGKNIDPRRDRLFEQMGGKHDISPTNIQKMIDYGGKIIAISRNPQDWIIAHTLYFLRFSPNTPPEEVLEKLEPWVGRGHNRFWSIIFNKQAEMNEGIVHLRYEDILLNPQLVLRNTLEYFGIRENIPEEFNPIEREVHPNGGLGKNFVAPKDPFHYYSHREHKELLSASQPYFDQTIIARLGYKFDGFGKKNTWKKKKVRRSE